MTPDSLKDLVVKLIGLLGLTVDEAKVSMGHRTLVSVKSPDSKELIGPNGEHLRSLNTIAKRMVEAKMEREPARPGDSGRSGGDAANFLIDVNDYHEAQMDRVRAGARMLAQRARLFKHDVEMPPQSAYERLVVHELFSEDSEIKTESAGEGKFRHVVLKYKVTA